MPVRAGLHPTGLYLALRQIAPGELRDAFLQQTVARVAAEESIVHVPAQDIGRAGPGTAPAGIIFHVARCGSTLVSQSLKKLDDLVVYSEPQAFNEILVPPRRWPRAELVAAMRTLGVAFAQHAQRPYVLKLSSWNTLYCDIVAEAFPDTPWVLSMRDPVEVGVSLLASPPGWFQDTAAGRSSLAMAVDPEGLAGSREEFVARVYGAFCEAAARLDASRGRLVQYDALPAAAWEVVAPHFSLSVNSREQDAMAQAARIHAKAPVGENPQFQSDAVAKQAAASPELRQAVDSWSRPQLARLMRSHSQ